VKNDPARGPVAVGWSIPGTIASAAEKTGCDRKDFEVEQITAEQYRFLSSFSTLKEGFDTLDPVFAAYPIDRPANHSPARRQNAVALSSPTKVSANQNDIAIHPAESPSVRVTVTVDCS
jgi:hypothetical protein